LLALVSMIVVVKLGDTGAYTVGRLIGRHKMAPTLSPGKTWEGTCGGLLCAWVGAWLMLEIVPPAIGWHDGSNALRGIPNFIAYGLIVGIAGIVGDLAESLLKRDAGVKDSSTWMPGMGGVLDVLDSMLAAAPVAYLFWVAS
jgi:phosphatidate cytidylyltransferase